MDAGSFIERIINQYQQNTPLRALAQLVPYGSSADAAIVTHWTKMRQERFAALLASLNDGSHTLTEEDIQREDFLHAFFTTAEASLRTHRHEKIAWFGRLLLSATGATPGAIPMSEHEDFLKILDDLSYREIGLLALLLEFERQRVKKSDPLMVPTLEDQYKEFWPDYARTACEKVNLDPVEFTGVMGRLERTGMYRLFPEPWGLLGVAQDFNERGYVTPLFERLAKAISLEGKAFIP